MSGGRLSSIDWPSLAMALATVGALAVFGWRQVREPAAPEVPGLGSVPPLMTVRDPATSDPQIWLPPRDRVVWLSFWSASAPTGQEDLRALQGAWERLGERHRFAMLAVAVDVEREDSVRRAMAGAAASLPVAVATREAQRAYGIERAATILPLHLLIGSEGRIVAVARGSAAVTIDRFARQAGELLDLLVPVDRTRFAQASSGSARP